MTWLLRLPTLYTGDGSHLPPVPTLIGPKFYVGRSLTMLGSSYIRNEVITNCSSLKT